MYMYIIYIYIYMETYIKTYFKQQTLDFIMLSRMFLFLVAFSYIVNRFPRLESCRRLVGNDSVLISSRTDFMVRSYDQTMFSCFIVLSFVAVFFIDTAPFSNKKMYRKYYVRNLDPENPGIFLGVL